MALNSDEIKQYAKLYLARKKLVEKAKKINKQLEKMERTLIDHIIDEGFDKVSLKGGITVSISTLVWPKYCKDEYGQTDKKKVAKALKDAGLHEYVSEGFNTQSIAAYLRERIKSQEKLPPEFEGVIDPNPVDSLVAKKHK